MAIGVSSLASELLSGIRLQRVVGSKLAGAL